MEDHYHILQVSTTATFEDIKASYRKLVLLYHPDKQLQANLVENETKFLQIQNAWKALSDVGSRREYDFKMHQEKMSKINAEEVSRDEFVDSGEEAVKFRPCRCGEGFELFPEDLQTNEDYVCIPCSGCSLHIQVRLR